LRKKSGVVEVKKVREGTGGIVSEEFLAWRNEKEKQDGAGERDKTEDGETSSIT
jgi:RAT1-interacting protein